MAWDIAFILLALPLLASYAGYPAVLWLLVRLRGPSADGSPATPDPPPRVSVIVAAHNEERVIEQKIRNFLALDYPASRIDLTIVSDGSSDRTCELAHALISEQSVADRERIRVFERPQRSGKTVAISAAVPEVDGEIVLFSDANTMFRPDAVAKLVRPFGDPRVGLACGHLQYVAEGLARTGELLYWRYESLLKRLEGELGELLVANGSIYALRKALFQPVPAPVADDMVVPITVARAGHMRVYVPDAIAEEHLPEQASEEFRAKARIVAQGFEAVRMLRADVADSPPTLAIQLLMHKVVRWFAAPLLALMLIVSALGSSALLAGAFAVQLAFYAVAVAGGLLRGYGRMPTFALLPFYFMLVNVAALKGFIDFLRGRTHATWEKSESTREGEEEGRRILFLSHYFYPEGNAPASRVHEMSRRWAASGHHVQVITCTPNVPHGKPYDGYRNRWLQTEDVDGIETVRVWSFLSPNEGITLRIISFLSYMVTATLRAVLVKKPDVIIATSPQFFAGWAGVFTKWLRGRPLILEIRDIWPESIVAVGAMRNPWLIGALEWLERRMYGAADHVVTVSDGCRDILLDKGVPADSISVITNGVDMKQFENGGPHGDLRQELDLGSRFVCSYVGTIGLACGLDVVLRASKLLADRGIDDVVFLLVGDGATRSELEQEARKAGLKNVLFTGRQPKSRIPALLETSDCCLVHLRRQELFDSALPSKMFEAMASARPVIMGVAGEACRLIDRADAGICIEPENESELVQAILELRADPVRRRRLGQSGARFVAENYERKELADTYLRLIDMTSRHSKARV